MSTITLDIPDLPNNNYAGSVTLRIWYTGCTGAEFIASDGVTSVMCGTEQQWYQDVPVVNNGSTLGFAPILLTTTDNSNTSTVLASAKFFVNGAPREFLWQDWIITNTLGASISFAQLWIYNEQVTPSATLNAAYLTAPQIAALITASLANIAPTRTIWASKAGAALNSNLVSGGGTDDTSVIQTVLNLASTGTPLELIIDGPALVGPLNIYGNTTIRCLAGGGFYLKNSSNRTLLRNANPTTGAITDKNISLIGGAYNGNSANQTGIGLYSTQEADGTLIGLIQMYGVDNLLIKDMKCAKSKTIAIHLSNVQNFGVHNIDFDNNYTVQQGGLQIEGLCSSGNVSNLRGATFDDFLAFSSDGANWPNGSFTGLGPYVVAGAISDITASNLSATRGYSAVRLFNGVNRIDRIRVSNITGSYISALSNDPSNMALTGNIGTVIIDGINCKYDTTVPTPIIDLHGKADHIIVRDLNVNDPADNRAVIKIANGGNIKVLEIDGLNIYDTNGQVTSMTPVDVDGHIGTLFLNRVKWMRDETMPYPALATQAFVQMDSNVGSINDLIINGLMMNKVPYGVYQSSGFLLNAKLSNIHIKDSPGGAALRADPTTPTLKDVSISNWFGEMAPPFFGTALRKRGDCFPFETTVPTFASATVKGGQDIVKVTFSEAMNAINAATGVTIKKNTVAQTILAATRSVESDLTLNYQLSANVAPGDTVTWEYAAAGAFLTDWNGNALANVTAQAVTNTNTTRVFDRFGGADGAALNGRTPSPTSGGNWATLKGTAGLQTMLNQTAKLNAPFTAAGAVDVFNSSVQVLTAESGQADVIITCDVRFTEVNGGAGIVFRASDASNYWIYWITPYLTGLFKVVAGVVAGGTLTRYHGGDTWYRLQVTTSGNNITGLVNNGESINTVDAFNAAVTKHGIEGSQGACYFDNFLVVS